MKRLHRTVLSLCLSLLLCVTCSSLFSVKASALTPFDSDPMYNTDPVYFFYTGLDNGSVGKWDGDKYSFPGSGSHSVSALSINWEYGFGLTFDQTQYDYYCYCAFFNNVPSPSNTWNFLPTSFSFRSQDINNVVSNIDFLDVVYKDYSFNEFQKSSHGFVAYGKFPIIDNFKLQSIRVTGSGNISASQYFYCQPYIFRFPKGTSSNQVDSIIQAITEQSEQIIDKIDEVLTPEGENNLGEAVDQITDQVQENLGALGFAHDTVENFIGLFNEEPPAPVINVPPLKMKIKGVEHQFFNGYQYDFRSMEDSGLSVLVGAVRTAGTLVLWWAFLQYCLKEFDGFFRR